jgi:hypothetical protein
VIHLGGYLLKGMFRRIPPQERIPLRNALGISAGRTPMELVKQISLGSPLSLFVNEFIVERLILRANSLKKSCLGAFLLNI